MANGSSKNIVEITLSDDEEEEKKAPVETSLQFSTDSKILIQNDSERIESDGDSSESNEEDNHNESEEESEHREHNERDQSQIVFDEVIIECSKFLNFPVDQIIIDRLKRQFDCLHPSFRQSAEFHFLMKEFIKKMSNLTVPKAVYPCIQELRNEMKIYSQNVSPSTRRKIEKLEKHLSDIDAKIKQIQEAEVNWDHENKSAYILEAQLKETFVKTYQKLNKLAGTKSMISSCVGGKKFKYEGTRYPEINEMITNFIKRNNTFPDYTEIVHIIQEANEKHGKFLTPEGVRLLAKEAFVEVGEELKQIRLREFQRTFGCYLTDAVDVEATDPAASDEALKKRLEENRVVGKQRLDEVIEKYAAEQQRLKLEPQEVGDGIDQGSEGEDDDDDDGDGDGDEENDGESERGEDKSEREVESESEDENECDKNSVGERQPRASSDQSNDEQKLVNGDQDYTKHSTSGTTIERPSVISSDVAREPSIKKRRIELESAGDDDEDVIILD